MILRNVPSQYFNIGALHKLYYVSLPLTYSISAINLIISFYSKNEDFFIQSKHQTLTFSIRLIVNAKAHIDLSNKMGTNLSHRL